MPLEILVNTSPCQTSRTVGSVIHRFLETFRSLAFTSLSNDLLIVMSPTTFKLVLSCLWCRNVSVSTNMFSDCRNLIALKPINLRRIVATKCDSGETVQSSWVAMTGTHCLTFVWGSRAARTSYTDNGTTSSVPKWYVTAIIYIYMKSPSVSLWKTVQHRQDYLSRWLIKFRTQYNTKTGPQTDVVQHILWHQHKHEAVATDFLRQPYATPEWQWFWHANKIYVITAFMLNGLYRNMPVFFEDNFLILEYKVSFGFVPYPSSVLIYKNRPQGKWHLTARLSWQWSVAQQRDNRPG